MMKFIPFEPAHLERIQVQDAQAPMLKWMTPDIASVAALHFALTGVAEDGRLIGAAGVAPLPTGAGVAWAMFSPLIASHTLPVMRLVKRVLSNRNEGRIEAWIDPDHAKAAAFAERLHFKFERAVFVPEFAHEFMLYVHERG